MARARSPNSIKAEELFNKGWKLVDIAKELDVPEGTVRRWKSTQKWVDKSTKKESERSDRKKANVRKQKGAPKGNKNAVGHIPSVPKRNQNAVKHGGYRTIYLDSLDEEEIEMIEDMPNDEEELLLDQIRLFTVQERRLMQAINQYRSLKGGVYISSVLRMETKRSFKTVEEEELYKMRITEKVNKGDRLPGDSYNMQTSTSATIDLIARLIKELANVQSKKTKALESLAKIRLEKRKIDDSTRGNEMVDDWILGVMGKDSKKDE